MSLIGKHILSSDLFDRDQLEELFELADVLAPVARGRQVTRVLEGAVMASLFFEASTRTRLSCETAFLRLGGGVTSSTGAEIMSISKGESLADTSRVVTGYCDLVVMRHPEVSAVHEFAAATNIPVVNCGNGAGEHPTQALLDMFTLHREFARIGLPMDGRRIALVGDLRHGRTVHSLIKLLSRYEGLTIVCVAPDSLGMPVELMELAENRGHRVEQSDQPRTGLKGADVIYTTRLQTERFADKPVPYSDDFRIDKALFSEVGGPDTVIMHPLPRDGRPGSNDLATDLNGDPRLAVFRQTDAGIPMRMALFASVLGVADAVADSLRPATWYRPEYTGPEDAPFYKNAR
ncbi:MULTISPECIES: aspartate carbamoyltransferase [Kitasatospora]|uniref:Aspartate carbamoyltransferase n=1 Tax=Kitasatospora setae (strain ATCC 33774 / DSM 43861 / JCM 3304 / KCC A-0304 / NBRC 14216 / KM-6054) TaxID=452652 RepID=E4NER6_KITSK|nr:MULTISPECIES: aspartate carbamoyltransferase [Kitasatospora]BAJ29852.1 putative aspartate carbamoyltransferase [Kitasatospora setae KM-6054]